MKEYTPELLEPWPSDSACTRVAEDSTGLLPRLCDEVAAGCDWISDTIKGIKQSDDEEVFDHLYRRGHELYGFAAVLGMPKADHLLAVLEFALDYARTIETFEQHSLGYLVSLLLDSVRLVFDDYHTAGECGRDITDLIDESRSYLTEPLRDFRARREAELERETAAAQRAVDFAHTAAPAAVPVGADGPAQSAAPAAATAALPVVEIDDEPEELDIPIDKVGMVSDFCEECRENLAHIGNQLVELEDAENAGDIVNEVFRSMHTVKGGARLLKIRKMEQLAHQGESLLDMVRNGARPVSADLIDVLLETKLGLDAMVDEVAAKGPIRTRIQPLVEGIRRVAEGSADEDDQDSRPAAAPSTPAAPPAGEAPSAQSLTPAKSSTAESIRIPTDKLDEVLNTASEIYISRLRLHEDVAAIKGAIQQFDKTRQRMDRLDPAAIIGRLEESNSRLLTELHGLLRRQPGAKRQAQLDDIIGRFQRELTAELEVGAVSQPEEVALTVASIEETRKRLQKNIEDLEQLSSRLQHGAMSFRMVPISNLFDRFPIQIRTIARQLGKKVRLEMSGGDTELDKVLINQLGDPMLHILRNSIDHGIESPDERVHQGKPEFGHIGLRAYYEGSHAVIEVTDDGRGIDVGKVRDKAIERELVDAQAAEELTDEEVLDFIFQPGFSTVAEVSELSGRGVGMDVVRTALAQVQGSITITTEAGRGTTLKIKLPLTLAVVQILLVEESANQFAFPILNVDEILTISKHDIRQVDENAVYNYRGTTLPLTTLSSVLDFPPNPFSADAVSLVVLSESGKRVGVLVDRVLGRQEALIKNLGSVVKHAPCVMGCTILSDSRLVLILNTAEITHDGGRRSLQELLSTESGTHSARRAHTILVVDDSAIQRQHLTSLISRAGYSVDSAENGFEALKRTRQRRFAAFCVDIAMPLMDGFEFVKRLRHLPGHGQRPVFIITSRTGEAERDRARELEVDAFLEKPVNPDLFIQKLDSVCLTGDPGAAANGQGQGD